MPKTKRVGGRDLPASDFAYVGNPDDISTWHLPIPDEAHVRDALARFDQAQIPADAKAAVARKLVAAAKKHGIDASGFEHEYAKSSQGIGTIAVPEGATRIFLTLSGAKLADDAAEKGLSWPLVVMEAGFAKGEVMTDDPRLAGLPHYFPTEVVAQVAEACNKARLGRRHPETSLDESDPSRIAGWLSDGKMEGNSARAVMHLYDSEKDLGAKLVAASKSNTLDLFGASILAYFAWKKAKVEGRDTLVAAKLARLVSVDLVTEAGAGGKILPYAASRSPRADIAAAEKEFAASNDGNKPAARAAETNGGGMKEQIMKVLEALRKIDAGRATELETQFEETPADKYFEFYGKVAEAIAQKLPTVTVNDQALASQIADMLRGSAKAALDQQGADVLARANEALAAARKVQFVSNLETKLTDSKLPQPACALVREHFSGVVAEDKVVDAFIAKTRESFAAFTQVGKIAGSVEVGRNTLDKVQLAMDAMMGVKEALNDRNVRPFRGLKEAYIFCTGDRDVRMDQAGFFRVSEAIATTDFPNILLSSLTKKLIQDYQEYQIVPGLEKLYVSTILGDYKPQDRVRMGYLGDLPTVAEAGPYVELTKPTDEKITYSPLKKGGLLTISEETIRNDDLGKIAQFPNRLARAARHTLATFVSNFFITPPNYDPDGVAWFHATHSNLGSTALGSGELDARAIALAKQTEKDSGNRLGLTLDWIMIPIDLRPTAMQINRNMTGTNNWYDKFGENEENIIVNPLLTDVTDWFYGCFPSSAPFLEIGFLDGYQTPQLFIANLPTQGTQFTNDQLQYKAKFVFGGKPIDFRGVGKEVVAG